MIKKILDISKKNNLKGIKTIYMKQTYPEFIINHYQNIISPTTRYIEAVDEFKKKYNYNYNNNKERNKD
jgi:hypothetical protein